MKFNEMIEHCCECIKSFNPVYSTIDSHADTYLSKVNLTDINTGFYSLMAPTKKFSLNKFFTDASVTKNFCASSAKYTNNIAVVLTDQSLYY